MITTSRTVESPASMPCLLLAFEMGQRSWKLGFTGGLGQRARVRQIPGGAVGMLANEIARAKARLRVPSEASVISCYEAGRGGFWLHRYLTAQGMTNHVVDAASIEVNRRARRAKTDRLTSPGYSASSHGMSKGIGARGASCACPRWLRRMPAISRAHWRR